MLTLTLIAPALVGLSVLCLFLGFVLRPSNEIGQRMQMYSPTMNGQATMSVDEMELRQPFSERVLKPITLRVVRIFSRILPNKRLGKLRQRIEQAGHPGGLTVADYVGLKGWVALMLGGLAALYLYLGRMPLTPLNVGMAGAFVVCGFMLPDVWLARKVTARKLEMTNALPDAIDMLTIAVEAGLSFDQGMGEIVSRWDHALSREMRRVLYEIGLGKSRREALENLSERTQVPDVVSFVTAVNHAEELGASLGRVLNVQSQEMRVRRRQRAQEAANKVPIKMMFPLVFLIFPALFAVILGPGIPRLFRALGVELGG